MSLACTEQELENLLASVAFTRNLGFALRGIPDGECTIDVLSRRPSNGPEVW